MNHFASGIVFVMIVLSLSKADVYLHNPRGSNNRLNERSAARTNANRLFDSQNNNRGGYNVGDKTNQKATKTTEQYNMTFFQSGKGGKSFLTFEWTNQHGLGGSDDTNPHKMNGNIVLQYMCQIVPGQSISASLGDLRNGLLTNTQDYKGTNKKSAETQNEYQDRRDRDVKSDRGLHESWEWYDKCKRRERNKGLFVADQKLAGEESIYTRQNPTGTRQGYECPEERDYYPYWHPTDWKDIAVLTNNLARCDYYKKHSFNVEPKGECVELYPNKQRKHWSQYNNANDCEENGGKWTVFTNFLEKFPLSKYLTEEKCLEAGDEYIWGIPHGFARPQCMIKLDAPFCGVAPWTRDNHLGNTPVGQAPNFKWVIPHFPSGQDQLCVFRIRYNISTEDYDGWNTNASNNNQLIQQNPAVDIGATTPLRLAINTAQYGRTFQDRTHLIQLNHRLTYGVPEDDNVFNLNVRGKRGNIVQVYPAVEYDFIPNKLSINKDTDLVHIQWTGSNTHNNGNPAGDGQAGDAGEGNSGTDRNNLVQTRDPLDNYPLPWEKSDLFKNVTAVWTSHDYRNPAPEDIAVSFASAGFYSCLRTVKRWCETESVEDKTSRMDSLLNNAPASYGGMLLKFKKKGCFHYICSRNNNFSNRSQKGTLCVN